MKKYILLFICLIVCTIAFTNSTYAYSGQNDKKELKIYTQDDDVYENHLITSSKGYEFNDKEVIINEIIDVNGCIADHKFELKCLDNTNHTEEIIEPMGVGPNNASYSDNMIYYLSSDDLYNDLIFYSYDLTAKTKKQLFSIEPELRLSYTHHSYVYGDGLYVLMYVNNNYMAKEKIKNMNHENITTDNVDNLAYIILKYDINTGKWIPFTDLLDTCQRIYENFMFVNNGFLTLSDDKLYFIDLNGNHEMLYEFPISDNIMYDNIIQIDENTAVVPLSGGTSDEFTEQDYIGCIKVDLNDLSVKEDI